MSTAGDRAFVTAAQVTALQALLTAIVPANGFYTTKLQRTGIDPHVDSLEQFIATFPFTTKQELIEDQRLHPPFGTTLTYPLARYTRICQTSGTTAAPIRWLDDADSWAWMVANKTKVFDVAGLGPGDRVLFPFSFGPFLGFWVAFEAALGVGCLAFPAGGMSSAGRLQAIEDNGVTAICCTPTYAIRLGESVKHQAQRDAVGGVRALLVGGEPGGSLPGVRSRIEAVWPGARVLDHHGMTEIGSATYPCRERPDVLHVIETSFIPEVIDPSSRAPVAPEATGELVLTNLGRLGSPLLRYRTGDLVRPSEPGRCACGTVDLALLGGILGRLDEVAFVRGVNLYPAAVDEVVQSFHQVAEYCVQLWSERGMQELRLEIEPSPSCTDHARLAAEVAQVLKSRFALRVPVVVLPPGSLPRFEVKARRWVRRDAPPGRFE